MANAYLALSLANARTEINNRWPIRDKRSDGWIGDKAHQGTVSDHNPDPRTGVVRALDIDRDGIHVPSVVGSLLVHGSTNYVIFDRRIYRRADRFKPRAYEGSNPHTGHIHDSIMKSIGSEMDKSPYTLIRYGTSSWKRLLKQGVTGWEVKELQGLLNGYGFSLVLDSVFGPGTDAAVRQFQRAMGIQQDGIVGPITRANLTPGF